MTRKDFELIAEAIRDARDGAATMPHGDRSYGAFAAADAIAHALRRTHPRFEKARFMAACGFGPLD